MRPIAVDCIHKTLLGAVRPTVDHRRIVSKLMLLREALLSNIGPF